MLCEIDRAASAVLTRRFPGTTLYKDVCDLKRLSDSIDLVTAGFPCQDLSPAGLTAGIDGDQSSLVREVFRLLRARRTKWVLLENVPFMLRLHKGRALTMVIDELEALGYRWAYRVVDSQAFGVPQRRQRIFILGSLAGDPRDVLLADDAGELAGAGSFPGVACGFYWTEGNRGLGWAINAIPTLKASSTIGIPSPPAIVFPDGHIGMPDLRDGERLQGFPANWSKPAEMLVRPGERWRLIGNAVNVRTAEWIGRRLARPRAYDSIRDTRLSGFDPWPQAAWNMGDGRYMAAVSKWPVSWSRRALADFLRFPIRPLSLRATAGFLARARSSPLRLPEGFLRKVECHLISMGADAGNG